MKNKIQKLKTKFRESDIDGRILLAFVIVFCCGFALWTVQVVIDSFIKVPGVPNYNNIINNALFFVVKSDFFMDFFNVNVFVADMDPYLAHRSSYPPLVLLIAKVFSLMNHRNITTPSTFGGVASLVLFFAIIFTASVYLIFVILKNRGFNNKPAKGLAFLSLLFMANIFCLQRANYLYFAFVFALAFFAYCDSPKAWVRELSYIALAASIAIKIYPAVIAVVLLKKDKLFALLRTALYTVLLFILPFFCFKHGLKNIEYFIYNLINFTETASPANNFSMQNFVQTVYCIFTHPSNYYTVEAVDTVGKIAAFVVCFGVAVLSLFQKTVWKKLLCVTFMVYLLPNPSFTYVLIFLTIPLILFLSEKGKTRADYKYMVFFLIVTIPLQFGYIFPNYFIQLYSRYPTAIFLQTLATFAAIGFIVYDTIKSKPPRRVACVSDPS